MAKFAVRENPRASRFSWPISTPRQPKSPPVLQDAERNTYQAARGLTARELIAMARAARARQGVA